MQFAVSRYSHDAEDGNCIIQISRPALKQHDKQKHTDKDNDHDRGQTQGIRIGQIPSLLFFPHGYSRICKKQGFQNNSHQYKEPQTLAYGCETDIVVPFQPVKASQGFFPAAVRKFRIIPGMEKAFLIPAEGAVIKTHDLLPQPEEKHSAEASLLYPLPYTFHFLLDSYFLRLSRIGADQFHSAVRAGSGGLLIQTVVHEIAPAAFHGGIKVVIQFPVHLLFPQRCQKESKYQ